MENTPINALYVGLSQDELFEQLSQVETEISALHVRRASLSLEENVAQEHREAIQRALGCYVLNDRRKDVTDVRPSGA